ncbi:MAG: glycosyltransferase [Oscillospiraceae bacterium]|nr:glycosyltransferase [Oscillospiraceae bacterium]
MDKISVIITVYNAEPYIKKCIESVIGQTYSNLEVLLINDGSTDNSGIICDEYAKKDCRIKSFHKANRGVGSARNAGLEQATGAYLGFVDADDWIEPDMYEVLFNALSSHEVHLSAARFTRDTDYSSVVEAGRKKISNQMLTQRQMLLYLFRLNEYAGFYSAVWNKLYRAEIVKDNHLLFDEQLKISEDLKFLTEFILTANCSGIFVDKPLYHYRQRDDSLIRAKSVEKETDYLRSLKETIYLTEKKGFPDIAFWQKRVHCYSASQLAESALREENHVRFELMRKEMLIYLADYIESNAMFPERIDRINRI